MSLEDLLSLQQRVNYAIASLAMRGAQFSAPRPQLDMKSQVSPTSYEPSRHAFDDPPTQIVPPTSRRVS